MRPADILTAASADSRGDNGAGSPSAAADLPAAVGGPSTESGVALERLLPDVERRLRSVETQMDDLQRRLAVGVAPQSESLHRLRRSLELIAPALAVLGARGDVTGPLTPELRRLLDRVHERLDGAQVSAGELAEALRRSGVKGPELTLLLRELRSFGADGAVVFSMTSSLAQPQVLYAAPEVAYTPAQAPAAAAPSSSQRAAASRPEPASHRATGTHSAPASDELVRQSATSGSASAGPGGAFAAAGIAGLAALLCALALPQLLSRVQLLSARSYKAAFLVPLQRPG